MIEIMSGSEGNLLAVRLSGKVTDDDYEKTFIPALNKVIAEHGKIRCIYYMDETFTGWELGAMWDDAKFGLQHKNDFEKIAVIGGPKWAEWASKIAMHLMGADMKYFGAEDLDDAWKWV